MASLNYKVAYLVVKRGKCVASLKYYWSIFCLAVRLGGFVAYRYMAQLSARLEKHLHLQPKYSVSLRLR